MAYKWQTKAHRCLAGETVTRHSAVTSKAARIQEYTRACKCFPRLPLIPALVNTFHRGLVIQLSTLQEHSSYETLPKWVPKIPQGSCGPPEPQRRSRLGSPLQSCPWERGVDKIATYVRFQQIQIKVEEISLKLDNKTSPNWEAKPWLKLPCLASSVGKAPPCLFIQENKAGIPGVWPEALPVSPGMGHPRSQPQAPAPSRRVLRGWLPAPCNKSRRGRGGHQYLLSSYCVPEV